VIKKKLMKLGIVSASFLFIFNLFYFKHVSCDELLSIKIRSDKENYWIREAILVHYEIKNSGDEPITMIFDALHEYFKVRDQNGNQYFSLLSVSYGFACDTLEPGQRYQGCINIADRYGMATPGEYTIYLESPAWGKVSRTASNTLEIRVKEPTGDEKKALDMFLEAEKLKYARAKGGGRDTKKAELGFLKYQELVDEYPNSIYAPLALDCAVGVYQFSTNLEERRKIISVCKSLIEKYPNSIYFASAFVSLVDVYEVLKDKDGATKAMQEFIKRHPATKISERAEYWLEKIEKWEFK
jgi:outer membrane protein assembly factor BamD (BamD/ComL family)